MNLYRNSQSSWIVAGAYSSLTSASDACPVGTENWVLRLSPNTGGYQDTAPACIIWNTGVTEAAAVIGGSYIISYNYSAPVSLQANSYYYLSTRNFWHVVPGPSDGALYPMVIMFKFDNMPITGGYTFAMPNFWSQPKCGGNTAALSDQRCVHLTSSITCYITLSCPYEYALVLVCVCTV